MRQMPDFPGSNAVQTDEADAAHGFFGPGDGGDGGFVAESVLQGQNGGLRTGQGWEQSRQRRVGGCFEANDHQVRGADFLRETGGARLNMKRAIHALNPDAMPAHRLIIRAQEKVDIVSGAAEPGAVETAQSPASNDRDFHAATKPVQSGPRKEKILTCERESRKTSGMAALFTIQSDFRYEITRKIFEGGMGIVYEAEQHGARNFVKRVAMKVIRQNYASQKQFIENFIGEARLVADLIHTNIVQTYHLGEARGLYFISMELIHGVNLEQFARQLAKKPQVLPVEMAVFITSRIARGLAYAHAKTDEAGKTLGIVHRDVSFKNIMIAFAGDVKLTDFGIAKARGFLQDNEGEVVAGKSDFMSPEQADFQITDKRSDLFSAGVVLANLLLGYNIFKGDAAEESRRRIMTLPLPNFTKLDARIDSRLNEILHRILSRDLSKRYPSAEELLYDLEYYIYHQGYGPTNETLGKFIRDLFGQQMASGLPDRGETTLLERKTLTKRIPVD
jgi:serine/threonine-protein kinase